MQMPPLDDVRAVIEALEANGAVAAVGGSGLLAAIGVVDTIRDWDVTTEAADKVVVDALSSVGLPYRDAAMRDGVYATRQRFLVDAGDHEIDVLVDFSAHSPDGVVHFPTRVTRRWHGLPIADPEVWADAYRRMGRRERAELLDRWLAENVPVSAGHADDEVRQHWRGGARVSNRAT
ncbi:hypothetical protein [Microlunatus soli]|uniref:Nucleotidyl transferase AbiEii toxin, Type IV TA system n=1 Tax=Microlunatus soli TaxID=630515 RepID=A0A1H1V211_9ACTN|nr:hypothetical protein [Microlunatus soli]SDS78723.1 hypothetical protein SAMN04489812_3029 [Microlunatus soli]